MVRLPSSAINMPRFFIWFPVVVSMLMVMAVLVPTLSPTVAQYLHPLTVDSDPENMLLFDEPARVVHRQKKGTFEIYDLLVVGVVNDKNKNGVFNPDTLANIEDLTKFAKGIQWQDEDGKTQGVIASDLIAPSNVDNIEQGGRGAVKFNWLMEDAPINGEDARAVRSRAQNQPLLNGSLVSDDGQSVALYIPITSKGISYKVAEMLRERIATYKGSEKFFITGMPIAQDTFAVEMFEQMAISTPMAMMFIFALLWYFFRNITLVFSPLIVANLSVMITMGLMIAMGNDVHILTSMVPIFIMPIAVLDSIHILSEFYDRYPEFNDRKVAIKHVMQDLSMPMLYTTLTTCVGFASLALMPLPPLQVLGIYVAIGVLLAWFLTMTFIPAYIILMPENKFSGFGLKNTQLSKDASKIARFLPVIGITSIRYAKPILLFVIALSIVSAYGMMRLLPNDNPIKWFSESHELRKADKILNDNFAGSYMAYLSLSTENTLIDFDVYENQLKTQMQNSALPKIRQLAFSFPEKTKTSTSKDELLSALILFVENKVSTANSVDIPAWEDALGYLEKLLAEDETFKNPEMLRYISNLQDHLQKSGTIGKSNSIVEIIKTVHRELILGKESEYRIPDTSASVAQTLITFQNSHRPDDLWNFVTPDYREANIWIQLKSGDNQDMVRVEKLVLDYIEQNPPPIKLNSNWFGLTHLNVVWQDYMILGMIDAFTVTFVIILLMLIVLFRSVLWGLLAILPLTFSVTVLFGAVGFFWKLDASTSLFAAISLGLAVDYAIHFLSRTRKLRNNHTSWKETVKAVFDEPARAISRNVIVVGVGFLPLLLAPLIPYKIVGIMISSILIFAGFATLIILPAMITLFENKLFKK